MARPYSDYYDDDNAPPSRQGPSRPTNAGWNAFVCALLGLGGNALIGGLTYLLNTSDRNTTSPRWTLLAILGLDLVCFGLGLASLILGIRALAPSSPFYRNYGTVGVVLGIVLLIAALVVGFIFLCIGLLFEAAHGLGA